MTPQVQLSLSEQMAGQAEFIVNNLAQTDYQHQEKIDVDAGVYDCDCNGFVSFVMERAAPDHYAKIPKEADQLRPRAFEYYDFFAALGANSSNWRRIDSLKDARRGDIIAWRFPQIQKGHDTGHVLFVAETPALMDGQTYKVRVYDSAAESHFDDTRGTGEGQFKNGVGSGFINFRVDEKDKPIAFQFAPSDQFVTLAIAIGRVEP